MSPQFDPLDLQSQADATADADDRARLSAQIEIDDLKWLMSNKRGRRFMASMLDRAGAFRSSFNTNALTMAFAEGNRNEGLRLIKQLMRHCPDRYTEMLKEQQA